MSMLLGALMAMGTLPSDVVNGRFFYEPTVAAHHLRIWLDTDGEGFVTQGCVETLGLTVIAGRVVLPPAVRQPTAAAGRLPVLSPDPGDRIFAGIDAQLGATWFQGRIVSLDYPNRRLQLLAAPDGGAGTLGMARLRFAFGPSGSRIDGRQYPDVDVVIENARLPMSFDTAATVALLPETASALGDKWGAVRATSFVTHAVMASWHAAHPSWPFIQRAGGSGIDLLRVPQLTIGTYRARDVWFSTRPNDDVFSGEDVAGKIGPTAFALTRVTLDYAAGRVYFDP